MGTAVVGGETSSVFKKRDGDPLDEVICCQPCLFGLAVEFSDLIVPIRVSVPVGLVAFWGTGAIADLCSSCWVNMAAYGGNGLTPEVVSFAQKHGLAVAAQVQRLGIEKCFETC